MKKLFLSLITGFALILIVSSFATLEKNGIAGNTGSPDEGYCSDCHSDICAGDVLITSIPAFDNNKYIPGLTYTISVSGDGSGVSGFAFEALDHTTNDDIGTLMITDAAHSQLKIAGNGRTNVTHKSADSTKRIVTFTWTAPLTGNVDLYGGAVTANGDATSGNDLFYTSKTIALSPKIMSVNEGNVPVTNFSIYPNLVKDKVRLSYELKQDQTIAITIYDVRGKLITELYNEKQPAGQQHLTLELPETISTGIYIVKIKTEKNASSQKIIVSSN